ncbi:MAG: ribonuclease P protein component [Flavobacteriaceae bacterium]
MPLTGFGLPKKNRLKGKKRIDRLFLEGDSLKVKQLKVVYLRTLDQVDFCVGVSSPKKLMPKAVHRNRVRRLLREHFRLMRPEWTEQQWSGMQLMWIFLGKRLPKHEEIETPMRALIEKMLQSDETPQD